MILTAIKYGEERYIWVWRPDQIMALCQSVGRMAADPDLSLDWYTAAVVIQGSRQQAAEAAADGRCAGK
jgi:hypothetical protein